jgi:hypothetical protein
MTTGYIPKRPWRCFSEEQHYVIENDECSFALVFKFGVADAKATAEFITRACNAHDDLLEACRSVVENWESGDLAEAARECAVAIAEAEGGAV